MKAPEAAFWRYPLTKLYPNSRSILREISTLGSDEITLCNDKFPKNLLEAASQAYK